MNSVKILHLADAHIGAALSFLGAGADARRYEALMTFERIINTASEQGVQLIAAAGDIFDSNKVSEKFIAPIFEKIASVPKIKVVFAAGNHDPLTADSPFETRKLPENLYVLGTADDCITFDDIGLRVYGRSFESVYAAGEERLSITPPDDDYINLMVLHGELRSDMGSDYNSVTPGFIESSGMDYIAPVSYTHSEPTRRTPISYAVFCLKKKKEKKKKKKTKKQEDQRTKLTHTLDTR